MAASCPGGGAKLSRGALAMRDLGRSLLVKKEEGEGKNPKNPGPLGGDMCVRLSPEAAMAELFVARRSAGTTGHMQVVFFDAAPPAQPRRICHHC